jgi:hypothetical protein
LAHAWRCGATRESATLRPVVHGFVRGISGAVVSFPESEPDPHLWLASEDEVAQAGPETKHAHLPITTCTTCGQHYFVAFLKDFTFTSRATGGGVPQATAPAGNRSSKRRAANGWFSSISS